MRTPEGDVMFCPGCPSQFGYVDVVTAESAVIKTTIQSVGRDDYGLRVDLGFADTDGGESGTTYAHVSKADLEGSGLVLRSNDEGGLAYKDRTNKAIKRAEGIVKTKIVDRIGRCANGACGLNCPAMSEGTFRKIVVRSIADRNKK